VRAGPLVFQLRAASLDALFRKGKKRAGLADADLHFHDSRHEGITRLAAVLGVLELARAVGHRDLRMLQALRHRKPDTRLHRLDGTKRICTKCLLNNAPATRQARGASRR